MKARSVSQLLESAQKHGDYWTAWPAHDFAEALFGRMEACGLTRADLARRLKVSPPYVTKVLRGDANLTLRSLARLARAVESRARISLEPITKTARAARKAGTPGGRARKGRKP